MTHPYESQPPYSFWRSGISETSPFALTDLYRKKYAIAANDAIATCGSCFAQHIGDQLRRRGFRFTDYEPAPPLLPPSRHREFGYSIYSARFGNVYTPRQLLQLMQRAFGEFTPIDVAWEKDGRWYDPYRPAIEAAGFASRQELEICREHHLSRVRAMFKELYVFVFTLGLTEAWCNARDGAVYPACHGTVAGTFDPMLHVFRNFNCLEVHSDLQQFLKQLWSINPAARILFTVSPVPLTATASTEHVLVATTYSKSVLRGISGMLCSESPQIDYFPSYEIVSGTPFRGMLFEPNLRAVTSAGVNLVMTHFFAQHGTFESSSATAAAAQRPALTEDELACEERILEMYS